MSRRIHFKQSVPQRRGIAERQNLIADMRGKVKGFMTVEMSAGQMVEDVKLAVEGKTKVFHYGRMGGMIPTPEEVVVTLKNNL